MVHDHSNVRFPRVSQIVESRRDLVKMIWDSFSDEIGNGPILLVSGNTATRAYAEVYKLLIHETSKIEALHRTLRKAPDEAEAEKVARDVLDSGIRPTLVVYVGGQTVADATKVIVKNLRDGSRSHPDNEAVGKSAVVGKVVFGGIITTLSNDGIFSVTASVRDHEGLPKSAATVAPDFVVGHKLTLLRQPYAMKISCVGDILAKISSLWDYNYSCRVLQKYHNDFAADLTKSAYEMGLNSKITPDYLHDPESIGDLYRSVQLCGLSMQLADSSETCSGSEHVGQKWVDEFIMIYNRVSRAKRIDVMTHGQAVIPTTLVTLHLQGQAKEAAEIRDIATRLGLKFKVSDLGLPGRVIQASLALGLGYRCQKYLAYILAGGTFPAGDLKERLTILEEVEAKVLPDAIRTAMIDAKVAVEQDFSELEGVALTTMQRIRRSALSQFTKVLDNETAAKVRKELTDLTHPLVPCEED